VVGGQTSAGRRGGRDSALGAGDAQPRTDDRGGLPAGDRERLPASDRENQVWGVLSSVPDPEIPVLSVVDLGIVRHVRWSSREDGRRVLHVGITPTYSGCPATEVIRLAIETALDQEGYTGAVVEDVLSPPWTSDWLTEEGRRKLESFGIAPPMQSVSSPRHLFRAPVVACPRCASRATERVSEFGSTPCKAHYRCTSCLEPFDYFKCL
jgi:ring-1,2-phenylacetyl-CoA epoxidase subunit PaaD